jgi:hypothetical protein
LAGSEHSYLNASMIQVKKLQDFAIFDGLKEATYLTEVFVLTTTIL